MSVAALFDDPKALGERLRQFVNSKEDCEEGLAAHSYAHGVITAAIVGPEEIPAAEWIAEAANLTPEQAGSEDARYLKAMMLLEHRQIVKSLQFLDNGYKPLFWEDSEGHLITSDWAFGFLAGVRLRGEAWRALEEGPAGAMFALVGALLQNEEMDAKIVEMGEDPKKMFETAQDLLPDWLHALYRFREEQALGPAHRERKVGRNDPCPCGSGKKYKKCCLN
jgi:uncharacterized protein